MPFKCSYCGQYFCAQHRLPENHLCPNLPKRGWKEHKSYKEKTKNKDYKTPQTPSNPPEYPWSDQNVSRKTNPKKSGSKSAGIGFVIICLIIIGYIALSDRFGYIQTDENNTSETEPEPGSIESPLFSSQLSYDELVDYTLKLINKERSDRGLNNVTLSPIDSAQKHADDMIENGYFSHWGLDGKKPYMRYYDSGGIGTVSENIAYSYSSGGINYKTQLQKSMNSMMYDDADWDWGHRDNIIDPIHNRVSIGIAYDYNTIYLVQDFENYYIEDYEIIQEGTNYQLIFNSKKQNWIPDKILVYYDPLPSPLTVEELSNPPFDGSYGFGDYVGGIVSKNYNMREGFTIKAEKWITTQYNHEAIFDLEPLFIEYGEGVYTLSIIEESEFWTTICIYNSET